MSQVLYLASTKETGEAYDPTEAARWQADQVSAISITNFAGRIAIGKLTSCDFITSPHKPQPITPLHTILTTLTLRPYLRLPQTNIHPPTFFVFNHRLPPLHCLPAYRSPHLRHCTPAHCELDARVCTRERVFVGPNGMY